MIEASDDLRASRLEPGNQIGDEREFEELNRGRIALRAGVLPRRIGLATHPMTVEIDKNMVFDTTQIEAPPAGVADVRRRAPKPLD